MSTCWVGKHHTHPHTHTHTQPTHTQYLHIHAHTHSTYMHTHTHHTMHSLSFFVYSQLKVPFSNQRDAQIAYNSLRVDAEPRKETTKTLSVDQNILHVLVYVSHDIYWVQCAVHSVYAVWTECTCAGLHIRVLLMRVYMYISMYLWGNSGTSIQGHFGTTIIMRCPLLNTTTLKYY